MTAEAAESRAGYHRAHVLSMALTPGARLGPYETIGLIGAGGMGEVYRARDTRLNRIVALKILPAPLASDDDRRARFEREAQAIAALNHPHICTLHDIGEADGTTYLVMEHLAGETLEARLRSGPVPVAEALGIGAQIADGLAAAHKAGIVHRDLKPANVMLVGSGTRGHGRRGSSITVKLLDFGLAKLRAHGEEPAMTLETHTAQALTARGTVIGTLPYMAPEQVQGLEADARTDIWALGAILYEMVAGVRAFDASNVMSLAGAILERDPVPLSSRDKSIPPALDRLVRRCLAKAREDRWADAHDIAEELHGIAQDLSEPFVAISNRRRFRPWWAAVVIPIAAGAAALYLWRTPGPVTLPAVDRALARATFEPGLQSGPSWSPDGQLLAYASDPAGNLDIWIQQVRGGRPVQVTTHPAHDRQPDWSPDGQWIAFRSERDGGGVYVVPALGGHERRVSSIGFRPQWSSDATRLLVADIDSAFASRAFVLDVSGGQPREVRPEREKKFRWHPTWYPPEQLVSFWQQAPDTLSVAIVATSEDGSIEKSVQFDAEQQRRVSEAGLLVAKFRWSPSGDAIYLEGSSNVPTASTRWLMNVWRIRVDPATFKALGAPERLTSGTTIDRDVSLSKDGRRLAFIARTDANRLWALPVDPSTGTVSGDGRAITDGTPSNAPFDLSADGNAVVYCARPAGKDAQQLWHITPSTGRREQLAEARECFCPRISRDGAWIAFRRERYSLEEERRRTLAAGRPLTRAEQSRVALMSSSGGEDRTVVDDLLQVYGWSADGADVIGTCKKSPSANWTATICSAPVNASHPARVLLADPAWHLYQPGYSPDMRWIVFQAVDLDGRSSRIGVGGTSGGAWKPLTGEGWADKPRWAPDAKTIYFVASFEPPYFDVGALRFDAGTGTAVGQPVRITHFTRSGRMLALDADTELGVSEHTLVVNMQESTGNIWVLDDVNK
jgi:serine/threonine protein kinase/Tol biopolymer transport system component